MGEDPVYYRTLVFPDGRRVKFLVGETIMRWGEGTWYTVPPRDGLPYDVELPKGEKP